MKTSEQLTEIITALNKVQGELENVKKGNNCYSYKFSYKYSDLATIWNAIRAPLAENGLFLTQESASNPEGAYVITRVFHVSGQWIEYEPLTIQLAKRDAQSTGSVISYARRYSICSILGIAPEDDDGLSASQNAPIGKVAKISDQQARVLEDMINGYDDIRETMMTFLSKHQAKSFQDMPADWYPKLKSNIEKGIEKKVANNE